MISHSRRLRVAVPASRDLRVRVLLTASLPAIVLPIFCAGAAFALLSDSVLTGKIRSSKVVPASVELSAVRHDDQVMVTAEHYPSAEDRTLKIDALLLSRVIIHADPGESSSVLTRFITDADRSSYVDVVVTNKEIVGADAGIIGSEELLGALEVVRISGTDSAEQRFARYLDAAEHELDSQGLHEAEHLLSWASHQSAQLARGSDRFCTALTRLASAYDGRGDFSDVERVYNMLSANLGDQSTPASLAALRKAVAFYRSRDQFEKASQLVARLVDWQRQSGTDNTAEFASDLQLLGTCKLKAGDTQGARKDLEDALNLKRGQGSGTADPSMAGLLENLGDCYAAGGEAGQAKSFYKQAKAQYDCAMASRKRDTRIDYDVYRGIQMRLKSKMARLGNGAG